MTVMYIQVQAGAGVRSRETKHKCGEAFALNLCLTDDLSLYQSALVFIYVVVLVLLSFTVGSKPQVAETSNYISSSSGLAFTRNLSLT